MFDLQFERFRDIYEFDRVINSRENNKVMQCEHSSQKTGSWSGTNTYEEAENLLSKGWGVKVDSMKSELKKYSNKVERIKVRSKPYFAGYAPIVPAAIKGVPIAMWCMEKKKVDEKKNCLHIYFNNTGNCAQSSEELMESGMAVLKLCILLEKLGIKVKIDILPFVAQKRDSVYGCGFSIKDYRQPFNLQKMAYPIAHTSIFRRQGFKWLETMKNCTERGFNSGYGQPLEEGSELEKAFKEKFGLNEKGSVYITYGECKRNGFDPEKIAKAKVLKIEIKGGN